MRIDPTPIQLFLSYARSDDEEFGLVDPFVSKLRALVKAKSGRALDVFVDREAIGWGENWRDRLAESVEGATVFIPLLSATYLERPMCREEFLAFHSKAEVLGVTDLLLPVLVFESPLFSRDSTDDIAKVAEALQYKCIEVPLLSGFDSPAWLACMAELASDLIKALTRAEDALGGITVLNGPGEAGDAPGSGTEPSALRDLDDEDRAGFAENMVEMQAAVEELTASAGRLEPTMGAFGAVMDEVGELPDDPTPKQIQQWSFRLAGAFREPALELEKDGQRMFAAAKRLDEAITGMKRVAVELGETEESGMIRDGLSAAIAEFGDLDEVEETMVGLLAAMQPAEVISVPLRKALRPARRGVTSVRDTLQLIGSWQTPSAYLGPAGALTPQ